MELRREQASPTRSTLALPEKVPAPARPSTVDDLEEAPQRLLSYVGHAPTLLDPAQVRIVSDWLLAPEARSQ